MALIQTIDRLPESTSSTHPLPRPTAPTYASVTTTAKPNPATLPKPNVDQIDQRRDNSHVSPLLEFQHSRHMTSKAFSKIMWTSNNRTGHSGLNLSDSGLAVSVNLPFSDTALHTLSREFFPLELSHYSEGHEWWLRNEGWRVQRMCV